MAWLFSNVISITVSTQGIPTAPVWSAIPDQSTPLSGLPDSLDVSPYYTSNEGQAVTTTLVNPPAGFTISSDIITVAAPAIASGHSITVRATNATGSSDTSFTWTIVSLGLPATTFTIIPRADGSQLLSDPDGAGIPVVSPPTNFRITDRTTSSITLAWDMTATPDRFRFRQRQAGTSTWDEIDIDSGLRTILRPGLASGTSYEFQIAAQNGAVLSSWAYTTGDTLYGA